MKGFTKESAEKAINEVKEATALDYLAEQIHIQEATEEGFTFCFHWCFLEENVKAKYLEKANIELLRWKDEQINLLKGGLLLSNLK